MKQNICCCGFKAHWKTFVRFHLVSRHSLQSREWVHERKYSLHGGGKVDKTPKSTKNQAGASPQSGRASARPPKNEARANGALKWSRGVSTPGPSEDCRTRPNPADQYARAGSAGESKLESRNKHSNLAQRQNANYRIAPPLLETQQVLPVIESELNNCRDMFANTRAIACLSNTRHRLSDRRDAIITPRRDCTWLHDANWCGNNGPQGAPHVARSQVTASHVRCSTSEYNTHSGTNQRRLTVEQLLGDTDIVTRTTTWKNRRGIYKFKPLNNSNNYDIKKHDEYYEIIVFKKSHIVRFIKTCWFDRYRDERFIF